MPAVSKTAGARLLCSLTMRSSYRRRSSLHRAAAVWLALLCACALAYGCGPHDPPIQWRGPSAAAERDAAGYDFDAATPAERDAEAPPPPPDGGELTETCVPLQSNEPMPALDAVSAAGAAAPERAIFTRDVFALFKSNCGGCHVDPVPGRGNFGARDLSRFQTATRDRQQTILDRLRTDDLARIMPPAGQPNSKPWSERTKGDPIVELATLLELWFAAGSPADLFYVATEQNGASGYLLPEEVASSQTNIGTCLPQRPSSAVPRPRWTSSTPSSPRPPSCRRGSSRPISRPLTARRWRVAG